MNLERAGSILILVSDNLLQETLSSSLRSVDYHVVLAKNTKQALEKAVENINIILVDDMFLAEHTTDTDCILNLKKTYQKATIVMMVTPETNKESLIHELLSSGSIEHCIFKPFLPQSLVSLVLNIITKSHKRRVKITESAAPDSFPAKERRKFTRTIIPVDAFYYFIDTAQDPPVVIEHKAKTKDISEGGIRLDLGTKENIHNYLDLKLLIPSKESIHITGQVIWEKKNTANNIRLMGVHFVDMKPHSRQMLSDYIVGK